jgi:hypothetical protein
MGKKAYNQKIRDWINLDDWDHDSQMNQFYVKVLFLCYGISFIFPSLPDFS